MTKDCGLTFMKRVTTLSLCLILILVLSACSRASNQNNQETLQLTETSDTTNQKDDTDKSSGIYVEDAVVNQFISDYNSITQSQFTEFEKGNIRTKYFSHSYGYYCELLHANDTDKIRITISETNENAEVGTLGMKDVFRDVVKTVDPSLNDDSINEYFDKLNKSKDTITENAFGTMTIKFVPDQELSRGHFRGSIQIVAQ